MYYIIRRTLIALATIGVFVACGGQKQTVTVAYNDYRVTKNVQPDSAMLKLLAPYSDSINKTMNQVIGFATNTLQKKQPESNLGNLMADAMKHTAKEVYKVNVVAAFVNYGGVRSYIPKGEVTIGKVYELMPFDNLVIVQQVKGDVLQAFLNHIAGRGGWPISGIQMKIVDKKATDVLVDGKPIDMNESYYIANSDYVANGGDDCDMLRNIPQMNNGYLFRDALISYFKVLTRMGKPIDSKIENRITL
ncbi:MAG TPA: hypothetical protein DCL43_06690 [Chitinophagaceae bacterium]|nr:hypothetical protein [Chitinophagaceae bacterium]HAN39496.1 hypothetical protein [Chitinophagaceae bacterium]